MNRFQPRAAGDIADLIAAYPLAWVVSAGVDRLATTPLPLLAERRADGSIAALFGHFARANPQVDALQADPAATFLFNGPQGYVSPRLVSQPGWGATWNYAVIRFDGQVEFVPEETEASVRRLAEALEPPAPAGWLPDAMGERLQHLLPHIIAFRAHVGPPQPRFKLGQDELPDTFAQIVNGHPDRSLARWMRRTVTEE